MTAAYRLAIALSLLAACASPLLAKGRSGGILPGSTAKDPVDIDAGKLDYFDKEQRLVYSGGVIVVNGPSTLKASRLTILLEKAQAGAESNGGSDRVRHIDAEGPVTLVSKDQIGVGDHGSFDRAENKIYLSGNVTLSQGENVAKGEKLVYDMTSGQATMMGQRVRSIFTPGDAKGDKSESKDAKPASAKPAAAKPAAAKRD